MTSPNSIDPLSFSQLSARFMQWLLVDAGRTTQQRGDWQLHARQLMNTLHLSLSIFGISAALLWWPMNLIVYRDHPELLAAIGRARLVCVAEALFVSALLWRVTALRKHVVPIAVVECMVIGGTLAWVLASSGATGVPLTSVLLFMPAVTIVMLVPMSTRVALTLLISLTELVVLVLAGVHTLSPVALRTTIGLSVLVDALSIGVGHSLYFLVHESYFQREALAERTRAYAELTESLESRVKEKTAELRALAAHLEHVRESERSELARELHDELGQLQMAMRIEIDLAVNHINQGADRQRDHLDRLHTLLDELLMRTRSLIGLLRPRILDDLGLAAAAEWMVEQTRKRSGLAITLTFDPPDFDVTGSCAPALFRVLQESLTNVVKHAEAETVQVRFSMNDAQIELEVRDDGRGLPPPNARRPGAMGLVGMRERMHNLDGTFSAEPLPSRGTVIRVRLPRTAEPPSEPIA